MINYNDLIFNKKNTDDCTELIHVVKNINILYDELPKNINLRTNFTLNFKTKNIYNEKEVYCKISNFFDIIFNLSSINSNNVEKIELFSGNFQYLQTINIGEDFVFPLLCVAYSDVFVKLTFDSKENIPDNISLNFEVGYLQNKFRDKGLQEKIIFPKQNFEYKDKCIKQNLLPEKINKVEVKDNYYCFPHGYNYKFKIINTYDLEIDIKFGKDEDQIIHTNLKNLENKIIYTFSSFSPVMIYSKNNFYLEFIPYIEDYKLNSFELCNNKISYIEDRYFLSEIY